jgi:threonine dehydratase
MKDEVRWKVAVLIISGSNFDHARFQEVKENSIKWEGLKKYFSVSFPQRPWALKDFLEWLVGKDDITYFNYRKTTSRTKWAASIWIETDKKENWKRIMKHMQKHGLDPKDITDNEHYLNLLNI